MTSLIIVAWMSLWAWEQSPYGRHLHHAGLPGVAVADVYGTAVTAAVYVGGWTLMIVAMMLPTTLPLLEVFRRLTCRRPNHGRLVGLLIIGYLAVWMAFGVVAHSLDWMLHALLDRVSWFQANPSPGVSRRCAPACRYLRLSLARFATYLGELACAMRRTVACTVRTGRLGNR
jgi:predicted metal-binding membrane protein